MIRTIKKQFRLQLDTLLWGMGLSLGAAAFGSTLLWIMLKLLKQETTYFPLGSVLGMVTAGIYYLIAMISTLLVDFQMEISMGCTRKRFFISYYIVSFVYAVIIAGVLILLNLAESAVCVRLYTASEVELILTEYLLRWSVPAVILVIAAGGLCGALIMRYGKAAGWTIYALWMILCIGGPRVSDAVREAPDSLFGMIGSGVLAAAQRIPQEGWILLGVLAAAASVAGAYAMIRRQQVLG